MKPKLYLISPEKIDIQVFPNNLEKALSTNKVSLFQLRLKNINESIIAKYCNILKKICNKYHVPFILNDNFELALKVGASGVHIGDKDVDIKYARSNSPDDFIIGVSCYDSKNKILNAVKNGANYVSLGTFFKSTTKNSIGRPSLELLRWCKENIEAENVCIGGINQENYLPLAEHGADYLAIISYIWNHKKGVEFAIESFDLHKTQLIQ